jgi:hypothetical protein
VEEAEVTAVAAEAINLALLLEAAAPPPRINLPIAQPLNIDTPIVDTRIQPVTRIHTILRLP